MKGFGTFALIVGICWVVFALSMDVSVSTGMGRVNNLGLMADRQVHAIVGGMIALAGLVMMLLGGKGSPPSRAETAEHDTRHCPLCAETIKNAAIKCKHCGAEVEQTTSHPGQLEAAKRVFHGWTVRISAPAVQKGSTEELLAGMGVPVMAIDGDTIITGPFDSERSAKAVSINLSDKHNLQCNMYWVPSTH